MPEIFHFRSNFYWVTQFTRQKFQSLGEPRGRANVFFSGDEKNQKMSILREHRRPTSIQPCLDLEMQHGNRFPRSSFISNQVIFEDFWNFESFWLKEYRAKFKFWLILERFSQFLIFFASRFLNFQHFETFFDHFEFHFVRFQPSSHFSIYII